MIKRIPCRVVSSFPLGKSGYVLRHASGSNNKDCKTSDAVAVNAQAKCAGKSVTYTGRLGTARVSVEDARRGQILDCYV